MCVLLCTSDHLLSKFIRWLFDEPASHMVILWQDKWMVHSDLMGVHPDWFNSYKKSHTIIKMLKPTDKFTQMNWLENGGFELTMNDVMGAEYDYKAFLYFGFRGILYKLFKVPMPSKNPWNTNGYLCEELGQAFNLYKLSNASIKTPWQVGNAMLASGEWEISKELIV